MIGAALTRCKIMENRVVVWTILELSECISKYHKYYLYWGKAAATAGRSINYSSWLAMWHKHMIISNHVGR